MFDYNSTYDLALSIDVSDFSQHLKVEAGHVSVAVDDLTVSYEGSECTGEDTGATGMCSSCCGHVVVEKSGEVMSHFYNSYLTGISFNPVTKSMEAHFAIDPTQSLAYIDKEYSNVHVRVHSDSQEQE